MMRRFPLAVLVLFPVLLNASAAPATVPNVIWEVPGHSFAIQAVAFSPDGSEVLTAVDEAESSVKIWDVVDGAFRVSLPAQGDGIQSVRRSPVGDYAAAGFVVSGYPPGGASAFWDLELPEPVDTFAGCYLDISRDGVYLVSGGCGVLRSANVYRLSDGVRLHSKYHGAYVHDVAFSPDGALFASSGSDNTVKLWDMSSGDLVRTLSGMEDDVQTIDFSPDGTLLAAGVSGWDNPGGSSIRIFRVADGALLHTLAGHGDWVHAVAFSADGTEIFSTGREGTYPDLNATIRVWRISDGELLEEYDEQALDLAGSPVDNELFAYGRTDGTVVLASYGAVSTGVESAPLRETGLFLARPTPNPVHSTVTFRFTLPAAGDVSLRVYDVRGRERARVASGSHEAGSHSRVWDGRGRRGESLPAGTYFARLVTAAGAATERLVIVH